MCMGLGKYCSVAGENVFRNMGVGNKMDLQIQGFWEVPLIYFSKSGIMSGFFKGTLECTVPSHRQKATIQLCPMFNGQRYF